MKAQLCEYDPADLLCFDVRPEESEFAELSKSPEYAEALHDPRHSWTCHFGDYVVACGGIIVRWAGHGVVWALVGQVPRRAWPSMTRQCIKVLDDAQVSEFTRLETYVDAEFTAGARWAERLGFELEGYMRRYSHKQRDYLLYARIRPLSLGNA